jgi:RNA polymerase sigma-70 factor (ECF subfamily)
MIEKLRILLWSMGLLRRWYSGARALIKKRKLSALYQSDVAASVEELETLYRERYQRFRSGLAPLTGGLEPAHDAVQEAFARALRERARFRGSGSLEGWVWRIAFRVALGERSSTDVFGFDATDELVDVPNPERDPELAEALLRLPPRRRLIVFLRYFADLSYDEIAALCLISEGTVAATLAHAHADLRATLTRNGVRSCPSIS